MILACTSDTDLQNLTNELLNRVNYLENKLKTEVEQLKGELRKFIPF